MSGFVIRQGTVYRNKVSGARFCLINHNPMGLQSIRIPETDGSFDCVHPEIISMDFLIDLRKNGAYEDLGDLPESVFQQLLQILLASVSFPETETALLKSLLNKTPEK